MAQRSVLWGSIVLAGALLGASAPWSRALPSCGDVPAAERERARVAGRCEGRAPIIELKPGARAATKPVRRPVPDLRGRPFNAKDERLGRFLVAVDYRPSAQRRDWVIDQVPRPPAALPDGGDLRVVLSDGALVRVPDVRGGFARALTLLHRAGLGWVPGDETAGRVIGQVPAAGEAVKPGTRIALRIASARTSRSPIVPAAATPGPVALAPESTKPEVAPPPRPSAPAPSAAPPPAPSAAPGTAPAGAGPPAAAPRAPAGPTPGPAAPAMTMPDLHGLLFDVARQRLAGFNVDRVHRAGVEVGGTVIGQSPPAGTALSRGASIRLVLSDGSLVRVPRVRSFRIDEARQRLAPGELRPVIAYVPGDAPAGTVLGQQPAEGQIAERGSAVRLTVSSGPAAPAAVAVPDLVGSTLDRARDQLGKLQVARSERAAREPAGTILEQTPAPGTRVEPGSTVSVVVSSGGRPEVMELANVVGQGVDAATGALSEFRLERQTVPDTAPAGRVLSQEPAPGAAVPPGSTVRLRISDGSRVIAPTLAQMTLGEARDAARAAGLAVETDSADAAASARVTAQEPAPGTEVARGSPVRLVVEQRVLPFDAPDGARDAWERTSAFVRQQPPRNLAMAAVVLLALFALLVVAARRSRRPVRVVEPVWTPPDDRVEPRVSTTPRVEHPDAARDTGHPLPTRGLSERPAPPRDAPERPAPARDVPERPAPALRVDASPAPAVAPPMAAPATPALSAITATPATPADEPSGPIFTPPRPLLPPLLKRRKAKAAAPVIAPSAPEPAEIRATARCEADPAQTVARNAAPRGPEIRIGARLDAGDAGVRELPAETAPDELTEETK